MALHPGFLWFHPHQSPRLRRSALLVVSPPMRGVQLQRPGSAWTAVSSASRLGCWTPQLAAGQWSAAIAPPLAKASTAQRAWSSTTRVTLANMENVPSCARAGALHGSPRMPRLLGCRPGRQRARPVPGSPPRRPGGSSSWSLEVWSPRPTVVHCGSSLRVLDSLFSLLSPLHH